MLKVIGSIAAALALVVVAVELETEGQGKGAEKKLKAQAKLKDVLDPVLPDFANPVVFGAAGMLIDALVVLANKSGFFARFAAV